MPLKRPSRKVPEFVPLREASPYRYRAAVLGAGVLAGQSEIPHGSLVYAVYDGPGDVPCGYVARSDNARWWAWNAYGDMWHLYHTTRDAATAGMLRAPWRQFQRMPGRC